MRLLRFGAPGAERAGVLDRQNGVPLLSGVRADISADSKQTPTFAVARGIDPQTLPLVAPEARLGACSARVGKFNCVGLNYVDHAREAGVKVPPERCFP